MCQRDCLNFARISSDLHPFRVIHPDVSGLSGAFFVFRTDSSCRSQELAARHPQVGQGKQGGELRGVLHQPAVADFGEAKLALDHPERVFDLGADACLGLLNGVEQCADGVLPIKAFALAGHHGDLPVDSSAFGLRSLLDAPVSGIGPYGGFFSMQEFSRLGDVMYVSGGANDGMHQPGVGIHGDMGFHAEMPLVAFLGLTHLRIPLTILVLGGTGRINEGGVNDRASPEHEPLGCECGVNHQQHLCCQLMLFKEVAEAQQGALIRYTPIPQIQARELPVQGNVVQGFFHSRVRQTKPLLKEVDAQQQFRRVRRPTCLAGRHMRHDLRHKFRPRNNALHFFQKGALSCPLRGHLESITQAELFHDSTLYNQPFSNLTYADLP